MHQVFVNGRFCKPEDATVSIFDTGFYYGDSIYDVVLVYNRKFVDLDEHLHRLKAGLKEAHINVDDETVFFNLSQELLEKNPDIQHGMLYFQVTRGFNDIRYLHPSNIKNPSIVAYISPVNLDFNKIRSSALSCVVERDPRRYRRDIKTTSLMPVVLSKFNAKDHNADYVLYFDPESKALTEGMSSNLFIVKNGAVWTHPLGRKILAGTVRMRTITILQKLGLIVVEKEFFIDDLISADEIFVTGSIKLFANITSIDGKNVGSIKPGEIFTLLVEAYIDFLNKI